MAFEDRFERIKEEGKNLRKEMKERTVGYIVAALGLVVGLAWNDAIKSVIDTFFPVPKHGLAARFIYAGVITLVLVIATVLLLKWSGKSDEKR